MELKHPFVFLSIFCFLCSTSIAFNITKILDTDGYKTFNGLLSESGLAQKINGRQTITVLAVKDGSLGDLSGKPKDEVARVLSTHVILDYYDVEKLKNLKNKSSILTTLYQTTGNADNQEGFLNVTKTDKGVMFGSAKKGSPLTSSLVGSVHSEPYNISVLQVSSVIGSQSTGATPPSPAASTPKSSESPAESPEDSADAPAEDSAPADAPAADDAPSSAPAAADAPEADSPFASPPQPESPASDEAPADAPAEESGSSVLRSSGVAVAVAVAAAAVVGV